MVRLGIDSRDVFAPEPRGIGKSLRALIQQIAVNVPDWKLTLFTNRLHGEAFPAPMQTQLIDIRGDRYDLWNNVRLPLATWTSRIDILHCPSQTGPAFSPCPVVLTVHDLIPLRIDDGWHPKQVARFRKSLARSVANAAQIIAISDFTRRDLLSEFNVDDKKVDVVHWGIERSYYEADTSKEWQDLSRLLSLAQPFFVAFAGDSPRKNVRNILEAFANIVHGRRIDAQLVLIGVPQSAEAKYDTIVDHFDITKRTVRLGFLSDQEIIALLSRCEALVYPSLYEGFGLPVLEGMAAGAPVITSNCTSLPEIAGGAALLVDPADPGAIADAMRECFVNSALKTDLKNRGLRHIENFSWARAARETLASYSKALNS